MASVLSEVHSHLRSALAGMRTEGGFSVNSPLVVWSSEIATPPSARPCIVLTHESTAIDKRTRIGNWRQTSTVQALVILTPGSKEQTRAKIEAAVADIQRAVMVDHTRGGKAIDTTVTVANTESPEELLPDAFGSLMIQVEFYTTANNPGTTVPA